MKPNDAMMAAPSSSASGSSDSSPNREPVTKRRRRRTLATHKHTIGAFREASRPFQPPWCILTPLHDDNTASTAICVCDGSGVNILVEKADTSNAVSQASAGASVLHNFAQVSRVDLNHVLGPNDRISCVAACRSPEDWVIVGQESGRLVLIDVEEEAVKCEFSAERESGEVCSIATGDARIFASGHSTGEVLLWSYAFGEDGAEDGDDAGDAGSAKQRTVRDTPVAVAARLKGRVVSMSMRSRSLAMTCSGGQVHVASIRGKGQQTSCEVVMSCRGVEYGEALFVCWYGDDRLVTGGEDDRLWITVINGGKDGATKRTELHGHTCYVTGGVVDTREGAADDAPPRIISCGLDGRIILWMPYRSKLLVHEEGESFYEIASNGQALYTLSVDPNGRWSLNRYLLRSDPWRPALEA